MTYLEYRAALAALTTEHRIRVAALNAEYNSQDRSEAKAARAKHARDARTAQRIDSDALQYLALFDSQNRAALAGTGELDQVQRACELSNGRYAFRQLDATQWEVTKTVTK